MTKSTFTIKLEGLTPETVISPDTVSLGDLAHFLEPLEKCILETARSQGLRGEEKPILSLVGIESGSNLLVLSVEQSLIDPIIALTSAVRAKDFSSLSNLALQSLRDIGNWMKRLKCSARFASQDFSAAIDAEITPQTDIPSVRELHGITTIYGQCVRVGGEKPRASIRLLNGKLIVAEIDTAQAIELAKHLYEEVGLEGEATWDTAAFEVLGFKVHKILKHKVANLEESFKRLYAAGGSIWDGIDDIAYIQELRAE